MKIFHLLNDFSGSTSIINDLVSFNEKNVQVITSKSKGRIKSSYISNYNSYIYVDSFIKKLVMLIRVYLSTILYCIFSSEKIILSTILFAPVALLVRKSNISIDAGKIQRKKSSRNAGESWGRFKKENLGYN